ncbi:MAG TPA: hypothetical protein PLW86_18690, partial [Rhodocyclaceae bacterium]|nr:hypothetical protein [Rhodocyclaceae bacterium]
MTHKILIADDEPNIVISLEFLMKREGFEVAIASSGTAETVAAMVAAVRTGSVPQTLNRFEFTSAELDGVVDALTAERTPERRAALPGL